MANKLLARRGPEANRSGITPLAGEIIWATDTKKLYVGDGSTAGGIAVGGGVPDGGVLNDILVKQSATAGDVAWEPLLTNPTISQMITTKVLLSEITDPGTGEFDFTGLDLTGVKKLYIEGWVRSSLVGQVDDLFCYFNGDETATNYHFQSIGGGAGGLAGPQGDSAKIGDDTIPGTTATAGSKGVVTITMEDPAGSGVKGVVSETFLRRSATIQSMNLIAMSHDSMTAAITQLTIKTAASSLTGNLRLYAEMPVEVAASTYLGPASAVIRAKTLVQTIPITGGKFDFTNIPQTGGDLVIEGFLESSVAAVSDFGRLFFNNDTTLTNYFMQYHYGLNNVDGGFEIADPVILRVAGSTAVEMSRVRITVFDYTNATRVKHAKYETEVYQTVGAEVMLSEGAIYHDTLAAAITRLTVQTDNDPTDTFTGSLSLYIEGDVAVAGSDGPATTMEAKVPIATITNTVPGEFDFDNIPAGYDKICIEGYAQSNQGGITYDKMHVYLNTDLTDANYHSQYHAGNNGLTEAVQSALPYVGYVSTPTSSSPQTEMLMSIANYTGADRKFVRTTASLEYTLGDLIDGHSLVRSSVTAPVTRVRVRTDAHPTQQLTGKLTLYGVKQVQVNSVLAVHDHAIADVTGLQAALDGKVDDAQVLTNVPGGALFTDTVYTHPSFSSLAPTLTGALVPATFTTNTEGHVTGMTTRTLTLANLGYTGSPTANDYTHPASHAISFITGLQSALDAKAPINNAVMTGVTEVASLKIGVWTISVVSGVLVFNNGSDRMELTALGKLSVTGDMEAGATL